MTTDTEALTYDHIAALALEHGFKLKPQVDGRMALNDYVIDFARAVYDIGHAAAVDNLRAQLAEAQKDAKRYSWLRMNRLWLKANLPTIAAPDFDAAIDAAIDAAKGEKNGA